MDNDAPRGEGLATWVKDQWVRADRALAEQRRDYWLNLAFFQGDQWVFWHKGQNTVNEWDPGDGRVRLVVNRIRPNLTTLLSKLQKRELAFEVQANGADDASMGGAKLAEHLLEATRNDQMWEQVRGDELFAAYLGGTSAVAVEWDPNAGEQLAIDPETSEPVNEGQVTLSALAITEFTLEPGTRYWMDSRWFIMCRAMPAAQVKDHFKLKDTPQPDASASAGPLQRRLWAERGYPANAELTNVYTFYQRPSKGNEKGRYAVVVNAQTVVDKPWPFPFKSLNLYPFRQAKIPKRWTGDTLLNDARSLQVAFNHARSCLSEHMKLAGNARMAISDGSSLTSEDFSDLPGEHIFYDGTTGSPPTWIAPPTLPRWLVDNATKLSGELDDLIGVHAISRGQAPGDRNSGLALSVLAEQDESPTGLLAHDQSQGWGYIASLILKCWEGLVAEYRETSVTGPGGVPSSRRWTGSMLHGQTRAKVPLDNVLPHSRMATQAWLLNIMQQVPALGQALQSDPAALAKLIDLPAADKIGALVDADCAWAQEENMLMIDGQIPSLGDDPFPMPFDDHAKHIAEHNRLRKQPAYVYADAKVRRIVDMHITAHENLVLQEMEQQRQLNALIPNAGAMPQAHEPAGSAVPPDFAEQMASMAPPPGAQGNGTAPPPAMAGMR